MVAEPWFHLCKKLQFMGQVFLYSVWNLTLIMLYYISIAFVPSAELNTGNFFLNQWYLWIVVKLLLYPLHTKFGGGGVYWFYPVCPSVHPSVYLSPICGHDIVHACSERWVHGFFWKYVHWLLTIWRCAPGIFIYIG